MSEFFNRIDKNREERTPEVDNLILEIVSQKLKEHGLPTNAEQALKKFVKTRYSAALQEVVRKKIGEEFPLLSVYEKTLVYEYTNEGYESLNETLRAGKESEFERYLNAVLDKLPNYQDVVYRGTVLSRKEVERYELALEQDVLITEPFFISASKSIRTAEMFNKGSVLFQIASKSGKEIEPMSFFGTKSHQNEQEVLFKSKTEFYVVDVIEEAGKTLINLEEK